MLKRLLRKYAPNPLDALLKRSGSQGHKKVLLYWNRGLGDIALGLYAVCHAIRQFIPDAEITFLTRPNLKDGFTLLGGVDVIIAPDLKRTEDPDCRELLISLGHSPADFDLIIERPDPTYWTAWQRGLLSPRLKWQEEWDALCNGFGLDPSPKYIGAHVQTETNYADWRDWPLSHWEELFAKLTAEGEKILLFGFSPEPEFAGEGIIDLRGKTELFPLLSIIKNRCKAVVLPDSGVTSMTYYLDTSFPLHMITLWSDPNNGILKQNVASPNPELRHTPLLGKDKIIGNIEPGIVYEELCAIGQPQ